VAILRIFNCYYTYQQIANSPACLCEVQSKSHPILSYEPKGHVVWW